MGRNYRRAYRPEYNEPKKKSSTDVQPIRKLPTPTVNNHGKYRNLTKLKQEKSQPNR